MSSSIIDFTTYSFFLLPLDFLPLQIHFPASFCLSTVGCCKCGRGNQMPAPSRENWALIKTREEKKLTYSNRKEEQKSQTVKPGGKNQPNGCCLDQDGEKCAGIYRLNLQKLSTVIPAAHFFNHILWVTTQSLTGRSIIHRLKKSLLTTTVCRCQWCSNLPVSLLMPSLNVPFRSRTPWPQTGGADTYPSLLKTPTINHWAVERRSPSQHNHNTTHAPEETEMWSWSHQSRH